MLGLLAASAYYRWLGALTPAGEGGKLSVILDFLLDARVDITIVITKYT